MAGIRGNPYLVWSALSLAILSVVFIVLYELAVIPRFVEKTMAYFISVVVLLFLLIILILLPADHHKARKRTLAVEVEPMDGADDVFFTRANGEVDAPGTKREEYRYPEPSENGVYVETGILIDDARHLTVLSELT